MSTSLFTRRLTFVALCALALASCGGGDDGNAEIRLFNLSTGYASLDLLTNNDSDDDDDDETQAGAVAFETVSAYAGLDADTYTIKLRRSGVASTLRSFTGQELTEDTKVTYVAYGDVGSFGALRIDENLDEADAGDTLLNIVNVSTSGGLDVYLTDSAAVLDDTTPIISGASAQLTQTTIDSGTYRLRVTAVGDTADVRLDVPNVTFDSRDVATLILTATPSGTLTNAFILPQEGQPTKLANTKARIRGAVGLANGGAATARAGGQTILSAAAVGVISSRYTLVEAGSVPITLTVNGVAVPVANQQLTAGNDYTLLIWSNSGTTQTSLISDDNRRANDSGKAKLRLLNGMSQLAAPLTLAVDFAPIAEGVLLGQVSATSEVDGGTDRQFDISNSTTAAGILTRTGITLQSGEVYTYFVADGSGSTVGVLRRDR
jgi:hypothetical protein